MGRMKRLRWFIGTESVGGIPVVHAERLRQSSAERSKQIFAGRFLVHNARDVEIPVVVEPVGSGQVTSTGGPPPVLTRPVSCRQIHAASGRDHLTYSGR